MSGYLTRHGGTRSTPQSARMRADQVPNSAGGFVWAVDRWTRLHRFLILGSEGGSYYASEKTLTTENVTCVRECVDEDGPRAVAEIVAISKGGRAPKNDPALYALAVAISHGDKATKRLAAQSLPQVARIATHLYHFVAYAETMRGWGRTMRWAVSNWYAKNPDQLALQAVKYRQRDGWSHRDLLRLAHPKGDLLGQAEIFDWIVRGPSEGSEVPPLIEGFQKAQAAPSPKVTAALVREYNLPREALLSEHLNDKLVWEALLEEDMPMTAMIRNLATMTRNGVLDSRAHREIVTEALSNTNALRKSRVHPMQILIALRTYASGRGFKGSNTWKPVIEITDALDDAFYLAFGNVEATGKRHLLGIDVSGSMGTVGYAYGHQGGVAGSPLTPREAAVAMALVTLNVEKDVEIMGFTGGFVPLPFSRKTRLDEAVNYTAHLPFDRTDCAMPMKYALAQGRQFDLFAVYTDSETWCGTPHPKQALDSYRAALVADAKVVVCGMVSNGFTIADPNDPGMMDVVGFDTATPGLIAAFTRGDL